QAARGKGRSDVDAVAAVGQRPRPRAGQDRRDGIDGRLLRQRLHRAARTVFQLDDRGGPVWVVVKGGKGRHDALLAPQFVACTGETIPGATGQPSSVTTVEPTQP